MAMAGAQGLLSRRTCCSVSALQTPTPSSSKQQGPAAPFRGPGLRPMHFSALLTESERLTLAQGLNVVLDKRSAVRPAVELPTRPEPAILEAPPTPARPAGSSGTRPQEQGHVWVFSYGGNMCCETLTRRGVRVLGRDPAFITDPTVRLVFKHRGGHATLQTLPPGVEPRFPPPWTAAGQPSVHGVLYRLPASDVRHFQTRDYDVTQMEVETYDGRRMQAAVFVSSPMCLLPQEVVPPESYMRRLRDGAAEQFVDPLYQGWLSSIQTVPSAGLPSEYFNTPSRYISYSFLMVAMVIVAGFAFQHLA